MALETQAALVDWYIQQMAALREQVIVAQQQALAEAGGDYSDAAIEAYVATTVPTMAGAQTAAAQLTAAYLAYMVADLTGRALGSVVPRAIDLSKLTGAALRNGLSQEALYRRPFQQARLELSRSLSEVADLEPPAPDLTGPEPTFTPVERQPEPARQQPTRQSEPARDTRQQPAQDEQRATQDEAQVRQQRATDASERRAQTIALTDLELATTHTARDVLSSEQSVVGYRRVLTGAENCGMCVVAATRLYHKRDLMPLHPNCDCVIAPVMAGEDPGRSINNRTIGADAVPRAFTKNGVAMFDADQTIDLGDLLQETHDAINARFGASFRDAKKIDYRKVITVRQHGELGPVLTVARHKFTKRQIRERDLKAR
jgi:hypothetical protein